MVVPSRWQPRLTLYDGIRDFSLLYRRIDGNVYRNSTGRVTTTA